MADVSSVPKHPVAPRVAHGHKKPHVGPDHAAYKLAHEKTVGQGSDEWWAKVGGKPRSARLAREHP
jgi:acetyl-CoA synthetase